MEPMELNTMATFITQLQEGGMDSTKELNKAFCVEPKLTKQNTYEITSVCARCVIRDR